MDTRERFKGRIKRPFAKEKAVLQTHSPKPHDVIRFPTRSEGAFAKWRTQPLSLLKNLLGPKHIYDEAPR